MAPPADGIRDISVAVRVGTPEWPGDVAFQCGWTARIADGASVNLSSTTSSPHVGTHADAPLHVHDGWPAIDSLPLEPFLGPCHVVDVSAAPAGILGMQADDPRFDGVERLLLLTGRSIADGAFPAEWPVLALGTIQALMARGLLLVGVDAPSVDQRESKTLEVHHAIFAGSGCILENLDLRGVPEGEYELVALPQRLVGLDAAPVRAVLRSR